MSAHPRLSLNQATVKYAFLADALAVTGEAGIRAIGLWREPVAEVGLEKACTLVADSDLRVSSLCRAGFFTAPRSPPGRRLSLKTAVRSRRPRRWPRPAHPARHRCSSWSPGASGR
jgi:hypothetical protein